MWAAQSVHARRNRRGTCTTHHVGTAGPPQCCRCCRRERRACGVCPWPHASLSAVHYYGPVHLNSAHQLSVLDGECSSCPCTASCSEHAGGEVWWRSHTPNMCSTCGQGLPTGCCPLLHGSSRGSHSLGRITTWLAALRPLHGTVRSIGRGGQIESTLWFAWVWVWVCWGKGGLLQS